MQHRTIAFIGAGNMSRSIISGLVKSGYPADLITAANPSTPKLDALSADFGINVTQDNRAAISAADVVVLAVKPQLMEEVCGAFAELSGLSDKLFVSIAAGIEVKRLQQMLGGDYAVVRTMPNTPSLLGKGMTGLYAPSQISDADRDYTGDLMAMVGDVLWVAQETQINGVIAAAGSSPAYFFLVLQAMQEEAERMGFSHSDARALVQQAALGAAEMVCQNPDTEIETLRTNVMSKKGTTAQAVEYLQEHKVPEIFAGAMQAAVKRAEEMAKLF